MEKLYEYLGILVLFHSNEHDPIHVHGRYQDRESKAEIIVLDGKAIEIRIVFTKSKLLKSPQLKDFETLVKYYADDIIQSWIDYFVFHKQVTSKRITTRIK